MQIYKEPNRQYKVYDSTVLATCTWNNSFKMPPVWRSLYFITKLPDLSCYVRIDSCIFLALANSMGKSYQLSLGFCHKFVGNIASPWTNYAIWILPTVFRKLLLHYGFLTFGLAWEDKQSVRPGREFAASFARKPQGKGSFSGSSTVWDLPKGGLLSMLHTERCCLAWMISLDSPQKEVL